MNATKPELRNVSCTSRHGNRVALGCEFDGARYHVWMDPKTELIEEAIYKNPLVDRDHPDYFRTRKLNEKSRPMAALIQAMLEVYRRDGLLKGLEAKEAAEQSEREAKANAEHAARLKREAGEKLYDALKEVVSLLPKDQEGLMKLGLDAWIYDARAAIKEAETGESL